MGPGIEALTNAIALRRQNGHMEVLPQIPGVEFNLCWNVYPGFQDENNLSLALELRVRGFSFLFTGDMEKAGFNNLLKGYVPFSDMLKRTHVLMASHHGRRNGICEDMFDVYGCKPVLVVISDDYKQYESQETTNYYRSKVFGYRGFRGQDLRHVLTTRRDREIQFSFRNGNCFPQ
jgi:beta-lactamase superfamily II metal-dependent hydrolase